MIHLIFGCTEMTLKTDDPLLQVVEIIIVFYCPVVVQVQSWPGCHKIPLTSVLIMQTSGIYLLFYCKIL